MIESPTDQPPVSYKFDRRTAARDEAQGPATAFRLSGDAFGRIYELRLVDWADGGVGAVCADPIEPGTMISVGFSTGSLARRGVVRRCVPCGDGYRVGIQFQLGLAA